MPSSATTSSRTAGCSCCRSSSGARSDRARQPSPRRDSRRSSVNPAKQTSLALPYRSSCLRHPRLLRRRSRRVRADRKARRATCRGEARTRCATRSARRAIRSARTIRYEFLRPLLPGLPAARGLARRLLRADQHRRRRISPVQEARLRRRSREDAQGRPGHRAVHHHRRRELPEQRRHRRQGASAPGRAQHHDGRRRHAAERCFEDDGIYVVAVPRRLEEPGEDEGHRTAEDRGRAVPLPVRRAADQLRAAAGHRRGGSTRRATRSWRGSSTADRRPRVDRRGALGEHGSGRRRRALVRVPGRQKRATSRCTSRARMRPTRSTAGWRSPAMDRQGNIGIGYSFGGTPHFAGQRFAGRLANDPRGS